jgi:anti-sigma factor RsiW
MNPCAHHKKALALLAAGVLETDERHRLEQHLLECPQCRQYWEEISEICNEHSMATDRVPSLEASDEFHRRLVRQIQTAESAPQPGGLFPIFNWLMSSRWRIALSTAAVTVLVVVLVQFRPRTEIVESISSIAKPKAVKVARADSQPSFLAYRLAANKSLEALDDLLARDASKTSGSYGTITAATREQVGLPD